MVKRAQEFIEPEPLKISYKQIKEEINKNLANYYPNLEPELRTKIKNEVQYKTINAMPAVAQRAEPDYFLLALQHYFGYGVEQNYEQAKEMFIGAEGKGNMAASNALGKMYYEGIGVSKNYELAFQHFSKSAQRNDPTGIYYVGKLFEEGKIMVNGSGAPNYHRAIEHY